MLTLTDLVESQQAAAFPLRLVEGTTNVGLTETHDEAPYGPTVEISGQELFFRFNETRFCKHLSLISNGFAVLNNNQRLRR